MLSNAYFLEKFRFDTAENEPAKNLQNLPILQIAIPAQQTPPSREHSRDRSDPTEAVDHLKNGTCTSILRESLDPWGSEKYWASREFVRGAGLPIPGRRKGGRV